MVRILSAMAAVQCCSIALAQMCDPNPPKPCARLKAGALFFAGTVTDVGPDEGAMGRRIRLRVDEAFMGVDAATKEIVISNASSSLVKGRTYLIDAFRRANNERDGDWINLTTCGASADLTNDSNNPMLRFLRLRAKGAAPRASLTVLVFNNGIALPGVNVNVGLAGKQQSRSVTNSEGAATFKELEPGQFDISATREHYRIDLGPLTDSRVDVLAAACPTAILQLLPDSAVSGSMLDSKGAPVPFFDLDLVSASKGPGPVFNARTDASGRFQFDSVSPGTYWLGANLTVYGSMQTPPTYYPGRLSQAESVPIVVKLGKPVSGLQFTTPDFGEQRKVQICVVDEKGERVAAARIMNPFIANGPRWASLGETLMSDETGCTTATGYTKVKYAIHALKRFYAGQPGLESNEVVIEPGDAAVNVRLVMKQAK